MLSGGNIDPLLLTQVITHGLRAAGRYLAVRIVIPDRPGGLVRTPRRRAGHVGERRRRRSRAHRRDSSAIDEVDVLMTVETQGPDHRASVLTALREHGYDVREQT